VVTDAAQLPTVPADDISLEASRLTEAALTARLDLRLMGGLGVWLTSPSVRRPPYARQYQDLDFAASSSHRSRVAAFFESMGYRPERMFNALHGARRLNFLHPERRWSIDVIFDELRMSHRIDLRGRLGGPGPTLDLADLLLTKLQIWEINEKDVGDAVCLLADHELVIDGGRSGSPKAIDLRRITALSSADWGLCHTVLRNLGKVTELARSAPPAGAPFEPAAQATTTLSAIDEAPKTVGWRARARVGERVRWYETPEEVRRDAVQKAAEIGADAGPDA